MATIEAHITAVQKDESTGWYRITTDHDRVKRLDTKQEPRAQEAARLKKSGALAVIQYTSNPRTDEQSGRTYENNYYDKAIASDGGTAPSDDGIEKVTPTSRKTDPGDAWRISLAAGAKLAVASVPILEAKGFDTDLVSQQKLALAWGSFLFFTPKPEGPAPAPAGSSWSDTDDFDAPPAHTDDDIPF